MGNYDVGEGGGRTGPHARMDHGDWRGGPGDGTRTCRPHGCTGHGTWHSAEFDRATVHCAGSIATSVQSAYNPRRARGPVGSPSGEHRDCRVRRFGKPVRRSAPASTAGPLAPSAWRPRALRPLLAPSRRRLRSTGTRRNVNAEFCLQGLFDSNHAAAASIRAAGNLTRG